MISKKNIKDLVYVNRKLYEYPSSEFLSSIHEISDVSNVGLLNPDFEKKHAAELYSIIFNDKIDMSNELKEHMSINAYFCRGSVKHNIYALENGVIFEYTYYGDMLWDMIEKQYDIKRENYKVQVRNKHNTTQWHAPYKLTGLYKIDECIINKLALLGVTLEISMLEKLKDQDKLVKIA